MFMKEIKHFHSNFVIKPLLKVFRNILDTANFEIKPLLQASRITLSPFMKEISNFHTNFVVKPLLKVFRDLSDLVNESTEPFSCKFCIECSPLVKIKQTYCIYSWQKIFSSGEIEATYCNVHERKKPSNFNPFFPSL